jgi:putative transposase
MGRKNLERSHEFPYHVCARTNKGEWFSSNLKACWNLFTKLIEEISVEEEAQVDSFVMMGTHFHMMLGTPKANLDRIMHRFMNASSRALATMRRSFNHQWGTRYKWGLIRNPYHYGNVHKYLYRNPVKAGICGIAEGYSYSTLRQELGISPTSIVTKPHAFRIFLPDDRERLGWLNTPFKKEEQELIRRGLRRLEFQLPLIRSSRLQSRLNSELG